MLTLAESEQRVVLIEKAHKESRLDREIDCLWTI